MLLHSPTVVSAAKYAHSAQAVRQHPQFIQFICTAEGWGGGGAWHKALVVGSVSRLSPLNLLLWGGGGGSGANHTPTLPPPVHPYLGFLGYPLTLPTRPKHVHCWVSLLSTMWHRHRVHKNSTKTRAIGRMVLPEAYAAEAAPCQRDAFLLKREYHVTDHGPSLSQPMIRDHAATQVILQSGSPNESLTQSPRSRLSALMPILYICQKGSGKLRSIFLHFLGSLQKWD